MPRGDISGLDLGAPEEPEAGLGRAEFPFQPSGGYSISYQDHDRVQVWHLKAQFCGDSL